METNRGVRGVRRRDFLKCATAGSLAALGLPVGTGCPGQEQPARAAVERARRAAVAGPGRSLLFRWLGGAAQTGRQRR